MNNLCAFTIANWLDIAFVVILLLFSVVGAKKGFVAAFFGFISTIIALVAAFLLGDKVMEWTNGLFGLEKIIGNGLSGWLCTAEIMNVDVSQAGVAAQLETLALPAFLKTAIVDTVAVEGVAEGTLLGTVIGGVIAKFLTNILTVILVFVIVKLLFKLFEGLFQKLADKWLMTQAVNSVLGALVGLVKGFLFLCIIIAIVSLLPIEGIADFFNGSLLLKEIYNNNPLNLLLAQLMAS